MMVIGETDHEAADFSVNRPPTMGGETVGTRSSEGHAMARRRTRVRSDRLKEDIRAIGALLREGKSPDEALVAFRRRLDHEQARDLLAAIAMMKLLERRDRKGRHLDPSWVAQAAYRQAESMLLARAQ
jgi:hypothetical protein